MSSRKKSKRRPSAQAPPPPPKRARRPSTRVLLIAGAVVLALVGVGVAVGIAVGGGSSSSAPQTSAASVARTTIPPAPKLAQAATVQRLLKGIPQQGNVLGSPSAPAMMVEYVDLQCPFCAQFETKAMPTVIDKYVRPGKLKVEARLVAFIGKNSRFGRRAAVAAGRQGKLFNFAQLLFLNQGTENSSWLDDKMVRSAAVSIPGLDEAKLLADRSSYPVRAQAAKFDHQMTADKVEGTPAIYVGKSGSKPQYVTIPDVADPSTVEQAIDAALG